jgi:hypothetical protein
MGVIRNAYRSLVGKLEEKKLLERPNRRWEDNIKIDITKMGWEDVGWVHLA